MPRHSKAKPILHYHNSCTAACLPACQQGGAHGRVMCTSGDGGVSAPSSSIRSRAQRSAHGARRHSQRGTRPSPLPILRGLDEVHLGGPRDAILQPDGLEGHLEDENSSSGVALALAGEISIACRQTVWRASRHVLVDTHVGFYQSHPTRKGIFLLCFRSARLPCGDGQDEVE